jgi:SH3 domain protein
MFFNKKQPSARFLFNLSLIGIILFSTTAALAETRYVKPSSEAVVRRGQGNKYKIIAMVKDGASVEFLEESKTHTKIRLANGKEGWIVKRFLSKEPPLDEIVASLRTENETLQQKEIEASQKFDAVSTTLAQTSQELDATLKERDQLQADFLKLQHDTEDVILIKKNLEKTLKDNKQLSAKMSVIQQENDTIRDDIAFKWFLAGGGVLVFGMLIGSIFTKSRKRKPSLL